MLFVLLLLIGALYGLIYDGIKRGTVVLQL